MAANFQLASSLARGEDEARLLSGAGDDRAGQPAGIFTQIAADQEAAHAVAQEKVGEGRVLGLGLLLQGAHVA